MFMFFALRESSSAWPGNGEASAGDEDDGQSRLRVARHQLPGHFPPPVVPPGGDPSPQSLTLLESWRRTLGSPTLYPEAPKYPTPIPQHFDQPSSLAAAGVAVDGPDVGGRRRTGSPNGAPTAPYDGSGGGPEGGGPRPHPQGSC
ncbi:unnamed protein product [Gadus morhua 'NCC']